MIPYSVSMPQTFVIATGAPYRRARSIPGALEVLTGGHPLDGTAAAGLLLRGDERAHVDDALALLAGDLRPVVRVRGVGQVLVLLVLLVDRGDEIVGADPARSPGDLALDRQLLRPAHDVLDHRPGR